MRSQYSVVSRQKKITNNQVTRIQRKTNTGCRKAGEYKGMRGGEHKQRSIPMGPDFVQISLDSTLNHPALKLPPLSRLSRTRRRAERKERSVKREGLSDRGERNGRKIKV